MGVFERRWKTNKQSQELTKILQTRDLTHQIHSKDTRTQALSAFLADLHQRVGQSVSASVAIASYAPSLQTLSSSAQSLGQNLSQASAAIACTSEEVTTTLEAELVPGTQDMSALSGNVSTALRHCETTSDQVLEHISGISGSEQELQQVITSLQTQLDEVAQVIGVIADISKRTNLLSLNAAIEAARAGVHGQGFAVVAEEVRHLALHTTEATDQVASIIDNFRTEMAQLASAGDQMKHAVSAGEAGMGDMRQELSGVRGAMDELDIKVSAIATGTSQIGAAVSAMNQDVHTVSAAAQEMLQNAVEISDLSSAIHTRSDQLLEGGLGGYRLDLHNQAQSTVAQLARERTLASGRDERLNNALRRALDRDKRFELLYVVDRDGQQISDNIFASDLNTPDDPSARGKDWSQRHWFHAARDTDSAHITEVYRSAATDAFCFTVAMPIHDDHGQLVRVLGADVRLSALIDDQALLST